MNPNAACGHCGGKEHYKAVVYATGEKGGTLPVGALHGPRYENLICGTCGLTRWFVSAEHLHLVRERLELIKSSPSP